MTTVEGSKASIAFSQLLRLAQLRSAKPSPQTPAVGLDLPGLDASAELRAMSQLTAKQNPMNDPVVKANVKGPVRKALSKPKPQSESDGEDDSEPGLPEAMAGDLRFWKRRFFRWGTGPSPIWTRCPGCCSRRRLDCGLLRRSRCSASLGSLGQGRRAFSDQFHPQTHLCKPA